MLPKQAIAEFKQIYLEEEGVTLSDEEATEKATALLSVFKVLTRPYRKSGQALTTSAKRSSSIIVPPVGLTKGKK